MSVIEHKGRVEEFIAAFNQRDLDTALSIFSEDFVFGDAPWDDAAQGRAGVRRRLEGHLARLPDLRFTLHATVAEGDLVAVRRSWVATHSTSLMGETPTFKPIRGRTIEFWRFTDGLVVESWVCSAMPPEVSGGPDPA